MNRSRKFILIIAAIGIALACNLPSSAAPTSQPDVATIVAGTFQALTQVAQTSMPQLTSTPTVTPSATPNPTPQNLNVTYLNIKLTIPLNLANGTTNTSTTDVEYPYVNPSLGDMPQHTKIVLNGYPVQGTLLQPQILVFRADEYSHYGDFSQRIVSGLRTLHYQHGQPLPSNLPSGSFNAAVQSVNFVNGNGIRYLTQLDQSPLPVNNHELIYYFQGITSNGGYYVQAVLPIQAPFLAPDDNPNSPLPEHGIPFHSDQSYYGAVQQQLNATAPDQFLPSLASLDALIQSITIMP